jgi:hypothetical protein
LIASAIHFFFAATGPPQTVWCEKA